MKNPVFAPLALGIAAALTLAGCATSEPAASSATDAMMSADASAPAMSEGDDDAMEATPDAMDSKDAMDVSGTPLDFTVSTLAGAEFSGASLAGQDSILWFWASWCPTCQAEAPGVAQAIAQLPEGVSLYGVPGKSDQAGMEKFVSDYDLGDMTQIVDPDGGLWSAFGVPSQPAFALINDDGTITTIQGSLGLSGILDAANELAAS